MNCPAWCDRTHVELEDGEVQHSVGELTPGFELDPGNPKHPIEVRLIREGDDGPVLLTVNDDAYLYLDQVDALVHTITRVANRERVCRFTADVARRVSEVIGGPDPALRLDVVAAATGIKVGILSRRLLGESPFTLAELHAIAQHLGTSVTDLVP